MKKLCLIALIALILVACVPVQAQSITMANPSGIAERDIIVYYANGSMAGYYNSTSVITLDSTQDYIFTMKPMSTTPLDDPGDWFASLLKWAESNSVALFFIAVVLAIALRRT